MTLKYIAVVLLITPVIHFLFLAYLKDKYYTASMKIFLFIAFVASLVLAAFRFEGAFAITICSIIATVLSLLLEKVYFKFLDAVLTPVVEGVSDADLLSPIYVTKDRIYAITSKGYLVIQYNNQEDYVLYEQINEVPAIDQAIFAKIKKHKTGIDLEHGA